MSTCRTVQPVSSGGRSPARGGGRNWRRLIGLARAGAAGRARSGAAGQDVQARAELAEEAVCRVLGQLVLEGEQRGPSASVSTHAGGTRSLSTRIPCPRTTCNPAA